MTPDTFTPSPIEISDGRIDSWYTITQAAVSYSFADFVVEPILCEDSLSYSYQVTDSTGTALVSSFDPTLGTISIYYDADI